MVNIMGNEVFKNKDPTFYNLNIGIFDNRFFFGKVVYIDNNPNWQTDCIVLSDSEHLVDYSKIKIPKEQYINNKLKTVREPYGENEIKNAGIYYENSLVKNKKTICWSNDSIDKFINKQAEIITPESIYSEIKNVLDKYNDNPDKRTHDVLACWVMATFCTPIYTSFPYLHITADSKETGKTKLATLIINLSFNGLNATNITEASLLRMCELTKSSLLIDDYEQTDGDRQQTVNQLLKVGYQTSGQTMRAEYHNDTWNVKFFDLFTPKIITSISDLGDVLDSRHIRILQAKTVTDKGKLALPDDLQFWQSIKDKLYLFAMQNFKEIKESYNNYSSNKFNNRNLELAKPVLSIAKLINNDTYTSVESFLEDNFESKDEIDYLTNKNYLLFKTMYNQVKETRLYAITEIENWLNSQEYDIFPSTDKFGKKARYTYWIGKVLSKIPLFKKNKTRKASGREYLLSKELLKQYFELKCYPLPDEYTQTARTTYDIPNDRIQEMDNDIMDDCAGCKEHKYVKFKSIVVLGRNYCVDCVGNDVNKQKSGKFLDGCY